MHRSTPFHAFTSAVERNDSPANGQTRTRHTPAARVSAVCHYLRFTIHDLLPTVSHRLMLRARAVRRDDFVMGEEIESGWFDRLFFESRAKALKNKKSRGVIPQPFLLLIMVGARGFEPPTSRSRTVRSTRLSHAPISQATEFRLPNRRSQPASASESAGSGICAAFFARRAFMNSMMIGRIESSTTTMTTLSI